MCIRDRFNALLQQQRAIVTSTPGTTRDTVSEAMSLEGIPVRLLDTAGIRADADPIEQLGIERSLQAMADADITLVVFDLSGEAQAEDLQLLERVSSFGLHVAVGSKGDLPRRLASDFDVIETSAVSGAGLDELKRRLVQVIAPQGFVSPQSGLITSLRHELLLKESAEALAQAKDAVGFRLPHELILLDLYAALRPLDALTGATTADDILNRIFSTFCIGK